MKPGTTADDIDPKHDTDKFNRRTMTRVRTIDPLQPIARSVLEKLVREAAAYEALRAECLALLRHKDNKGFLVICGDTDFDPFAALRATLIASDKAATT